FAAVGMVTAAFAVLRRQRDSLLICFALFAALYGLRLWISSPMLAMMEQGATFYTRLRGAVNYVTLIPALLFFISLGLRRFERVVGYAAVGFGCLLAAATLLFGDSPHYERINSIAIVSASGFFLIRFVASGSAESIAPEAPDFGVIRWGSLIFVGLAVWQNSAQLFHTSL